MAYYWNPNTQQVVTEDPFPPQQWQLDETGSPMVGVPAGTTDGAGVFTPAATNQNEASQFGYLASHDPRWIDALVAAGKAVGRSPEDVIKAAIMAPMPQGNTQGQWTPFLGGGFGGGLLGTVGIDANDPNVKAAIAPYSDMRDFSDQKGVFADWTESNKPKSFMDQWGPLLMAAAPLGAAVGTSAGIGAGLAGAGAATAGGAEAALADVFPAVMPGTGYGAGAATAAGTAGLTDAGGRMGWEDFLNSGIDPSATDYLNTDIFGGGDPYGSFAGDSWAANTAVPPGVEPSLWAQAKTALGLGGNAAAIGNALGLGADATKMLGNLAAAGLGAYASNNQAGALTDLANKYSEFGAPYRSRLADLYANPSGFLKSPEVTSSVDQGTSALMRSLSTSGNPFGSGNALQQGQDYASNMLFGKLGQEKDRLAGFGGLSNYNQAAPGLEASAIGQNANMYNAIGAGVNDIFNPRTSLADILKQLRLQ